MSGEIFKLYEDLIRELAVEMSSLGFESRDHEEFIRDLNELQQRLRVSLRFDPSAGVGHVEAFPGFNFPEVESFAAKLQGKKVRAGFITCSLNIGLLRFQGTSIEWQLSAQSKVPELVKEIADAVRTLATPFWEEFSTLEELLAFFDDGDFRVCRGDWVWRYAAINRLLGKREKAVEILKQHCKDRPKLKPAIENAIEVMTS